MFLLVMRLLCRKPRDVKQEFWQKKPHFLKALKAHLKQPLLVIWDGLKARRSRLVRDYLDTLNGHIQIAFLPPYAPDLNPVESNHLNNLNDS